MIAYDLVGDITVSSTTTSVSFTGLNITSDDEYLLVSDIYNSDSSGGATMHILVNGNTTLTNYYSQYAFAESTTVSGARGNNAYYSYTYPLSYCESITHLRLNNSGYFSYNSNMNYRLGSSSTAAMRLVGSSTFTMSSITQITLLSSTASKIMSGSRFRLYKLKAQKVSDILVSTAVTQVNITGLSIDTTGEYLMTVEFTGTSGAINIYANGNTTQTYYELEKLSASNTSVSGYRYNTSNLMQYGPSLYLSFAMINLKLTSNGYFTAQSNSIRGVGVSSIELEDSKITAYSFTISSISTLNLISTVSGEIRSGTRIKLYKLK